MLVAAGFVSEDKANEVLRIAHGFGSELGQAALTAVPVDEATIRYPAQECYRDSDSDSRVVTGPTTPPIASSSKGLKLAMSTN